MTNKARCTVALGGLLAVAGLCVAPLRAQGYHHHDAGPRTGPTNALARVVREVTEPYKNEAVARAAGYLPLFGCVSGPDAGAMGLHYVNGGLVADGVIDARQPEIVIYEPVGNGRVRLIGADYLVLADQWDQTHTSAPELMGQKFQQFESPNRFGLPRFYTLHVWAWKDSPTGTFVNWNTNVSCDAHIGETR
jgi:hypothetical protein